MPLYLPRIGGLDYDPFYIRGLSSDDEGNGAATGPLSTLYNGPTSPTSPSYTPKSDDDRFASDGGSERMDDCFDEFVVGDDDAVAGMDEDAETDAEGGAMPFLVRWSYWSGGSSRTLRI